MDDRLLAVLERIAVALERQADADPIVALGAALGAEDAGEPVPALLTDRAPRPPIAGNRQTMLYAHPTPGWEIVAFKTSGTPSGWTVRERELNG